VTNLTLDEPAIDAILGKVADPAYL